MLRVTTCTVTNISCAEHDLLQASDIASIVAIEAQVAVLRRTHLMLARQLELDAWEVIWARADGAQNLADLTSRVAQHVSQQVVQDLLPNFGYCEPTQRFARLVSLNILLLGLLPAISTSCLQQSISMCSASVCLGLLLA